MFELINEKDGIKWFFKVEEFYLEDKFVEFFEVLVVFLFLGIFSSFIFVFVLVKNLFFMFIFVVENFVVIIFMYVIGGICFSDLFVVLKM